MTSRSRNFLRASYPHLRPETLYELQMVIEPRQRTGIERSVPVGAFCLTPAGIEEARLALYGGREPWFRHVWLYDWRSKLRAFNYLHGG